MKKKLLAVTLVVALIAILAVGNTLAYLTDKDEAINVMELGNVKIQQNETDRNGAAFVQNQNLFPFVDLRADGEDFFVGGMFNDNIKNTIDKFITVTNTGTRECYVRTILAFETVRSYEEGFLQ